MPIFQATMESMTMKGFSMLLQTVFGGCFINSIHNMSYYMEVSRCPTLPLSWVSNCPVSKCPVSKCPVSSCPVSSCPGFSGTTDQGNVHLPHSSKRSFLALDTKKHVLRAKLNLAKGPVPLADTTTYDR